MKVLSTRPTLAAGHSDRLLASLDRYGVVEAFSHFYVVTKFQCTEPLLRWLLEKSASNFGLDTECVSRAESCWSWIASADLSVLKSYEKEILDASNHWNDSVMGFSFYSKVDQDIAWRFRHEILPEQVRWEKAVSIVETLDALEGDASFDEFPDKLIEKTIALLRPKLILPESRQAALAAIGASPQWEEAYWMNGLLITAVGSMGLDEPSAIEFLFDLLNEDIDYYNDEVASSLARLGSQELMQEFKNRYLGSDYGPRLYMSDVTERVYAPWAADYCRELLALEDEGELRPWLANALADQCMSQDAELLRAIVDEDKDNPQYIDILEKLDILTELSQDDFDADNSRLLEIEARKTSTRENSRGLMTSPSPSKCPHCGGYHSDDSHNMDDTDEFDEFEDHEDFDDHLHGGSLLSRPLASQRTTDSGPTTIRNVVRVSRNSPCPCGSGKKYKKCCMRK
ncbi:MAG: SEC-C domain-containing protein [Pirellula sp.]